MLNRPHMLPLRDDMFGRPPASDTEVDSSAVLISLYIPSHSKYSLLAIADCNMNTKPADRYRKCCQENPHRVVRPALSDKAGLGGLRY